jgi:hypothetical protein
LRNSQDRDKYQTVQTSMWDSFDRSQSRAMEVVVSLNSKNATKGEVHTLFAGFVFSFSKILSDCALVARPLILLEPNMLLRSNDEIATIIWILNRLYLCLFSFCRSKVMRHGDTLP